MSIVDINLELRDCKILLKRLYFNLYAYKFNVYN